MGFINSLQYTAIGLLLSLLFPLSVRSVGIEIQTSKQTEADRFLELCIEQWQISQYEVAIESCEQALEMYREIGDRSKEAATVYSLGKIYMNLGQYQQAIEFFEQTLALDRTIGNRGGEISSLDSLGWAYNFQGKYQEAIEFFNQTLAINREVGNSSQEVDSLYALGWAYDDLGQHQQALQLYQQALTLAQDIGDRLREANILNGLGWLYGFQGEYQQAIEFFDQQIKIAEEIENRRQEANAFNGLGWSYKALGEYRRAIELSEQALVLHQYLNDFREEAYALGDLGNIYAALEQYSKALVFLQEALAIQKQINNRWGEGNTFSYIGDLFTQKNRQELAIIFYKQSVNVREKIRQDIQGLPPEYQQSFTDTVADTYRNLADLLLQQNRVLEAQRVLDLLKVQELDDYLRGVRGNEETTRGIDNLPPEQQIWDTYTTKLNQAVELGKELSELRQIPETQRTETQQQRIDELVDAEQQTLGEFNQFIESEEVVILLEQLTYNVRRQSPDLAELNALRDNLRNLEKNAVLLYPLILEDRLELVLVTPFAPPVRVPVAVTQAELNRAIVEFRTALQNPYQNATQPAQQLYSWLIDPLESALAEANAETIIYAPDGQLRYIPLAALHDGNQWLVERFRINHITAASLTDLNTQPQSQPNILAGAFANGFHTVEAGDREFNFGGLPFAGVEVENLAATVPNTTSLVDDAFNPDATIPRMDDYNIVHLATHAAFVTGRPEDSFILFGDGSHVTLDTVKDWSLQNVDLVVLSACETGLGGDLGNGEEILGFGYLMQQAGARAAIASLWSVDDGGTQALMNAFYSALQTGFSKAEALRQAQIALITDDYTALGDRRGAAIELSWVTEDVPVEVRNRLEHPFYWAPFILIGNGL